MKKFIVACAAVSAITAVAGMSAMAAEYSAENNSVAITVPADAKADTQKTILVIPKDKETSVTDADIYYINQDAELGTTALLKGNNLADGTYVVKIGYYKEDGTFAIKNDEFKVGNDSPSGTDVLVGDVDVDGAVSSGDAVKILTYLANRKTGIDKGTVAYYAAAMCNSFEDDNISSDDATAILTYLANRRNHDYVGKTQTVTLN